MPTKKSSQGPKKLRSLGGVALPTGQQIYDRLMSKIEPELVLSNLKKLDAPYKKETKAEHKKRYARYAKAFKTYRTQYKIWLSNVSKAIQIYKRAVVKASEKAVRAKEDAALADLEAQMKSA
jgi:hypothetical protein